MIEQEQFIRQRLENLSIPDSEMTLGQFDFSIKLVELAKSNILKLCIQLPFPVNDQNQVHLSKSIQMTLSEVYQHIEVDIQHTIRAKKVKVGIKPLPSIKNIIAVASGKGGVGKSTVSANLAIELKRMGAVVGLLDADLYGPSQTLMMGVRDQQPEQVEGFFKPVINQLGIEIMSMGLLIDDEQAVVWRGPMISKALQQLLFFTKWGNLDYLIIDLPPGTGDTQLTLSQKIPVTVAVVVTTPQEIALIEAYKAISMFNKVSIPVLGIIENMSYYVCAKCHAQEEVFGSGGGVSLAKRANVSLLGQIPLAGEIREAMDTGEFIKMKQYAKFYQSIVWQLVFKLASMGNDYSHHFTDIAVE